MLPSRDLRILKTRLAFISGLLAGLLCVSAHAQGYRSFPGEPIDQRTRSIQERVEAVYAAGDYKRALLIYEKELAPIGDKYAQYMVGYMHLNAEGVPQDRVEALAWYRLAAERGEPLIEQTRDELIKSMTAAEIAASDATFRELWRTIGDRALVMELIEQDLRTLRAQTGTRIPGSSATGPAEIYRPSGEPLGPNFYNDIRQRLEARMAYLDTKVEIKDLAIDAEELQKIRDQEAEAKAALASIERANP